MEGREIKAQDIDSKGFGDSCDQGTAKNPSFEGKLKMPSQGKIDYSEDRLPILAVK